MKGLKRYLFIGGALMICYIMVQIFKPKATDWRATYLTEDKIPFGTFILRQRINDIFPRAKIKAVQKPIYNTIKDADSGKSTLLIIGSSIKVEEVDYEQMLKYMQAGNNIFLASYTIKGVLLDSLKLDISTSFGSSRGRKYPVNFVSPSLKREIDFYFEKGLAEQYFTSIDTAKAIVLGQRDGENANYVRYKFGKGSLFILPNPQLLTNYSLLKDDGLAYASRALSYLPDSEHLIWNEYFTRLNENNKSVLRVFFAYDQLRWAYYIALFSLVAFVLFEIKRRQRIIPISAPLKNTTAEFVEVVGRVYYQQRNNKDIADKKLTYLLSYIRNKYKLKTSEINQEFKNSLLKTTGANAETVEALFMQMSYVNVSNSINDQELIDLNKVIEQFYKQDR
ncbi:DUF4350 domain-containing protein [Pedobacter namyangjuensis]|uniref:DUF4350 domain-containing protein n=1 Tax=Pedobacter namyangjuensis TaxID=600626 RepID=UPI000DE340E2|nr:DUF4350 domain-containing protein [Pedobacter namyangjuensis]